MTVNINQFGLVWASAFIVFEAWCVTRPQRWWPWRIFHAFALVFQAAACVFHAWRLLYA